MNTEETKHMGNKLIAEFMGFTVCKRGPMIGAPEVNPILEKSIKYHKSWDWLMPVVEKCREIFKASTGVGDYQFWIGEKYREIEGALHSLKIEQVHQAIYWFIDWYNQQQNSPALGGRSIQSEGPSESECEGDRPKATPTPISLDALEKEPGWKKRRSSVRGYTVYTNGMVEALVNSKQEITVHIIPCMVGVSSMQELRTLESLVNGPQK